MTDLNADPVIVGYRIEGLAGEGGMGVVYRATQLALGRPVALKLISPKLAADPLFRERFQRESRLAASIDHPNVIPVYEAGEADGSLFLSMRWVEGDDLDTLVRRGGGLDPSRTAHVVSQVAAALDAAHRRGLVHRDVKPANVLVVGGREDHVYLTDFGLVKRMSGSGQLTRSGQLLGTIDYIAPEQIQGKGNDPRTDVYSLGCVLFHCLTGRVPFDTDNEVAKIYAHLNEPVPQPSDVVPGLPSALDKVVTRAMAKEPEQRFASAGDLGRAALKATEPPPPPSRTPTADTRRLISPKRRRPVAGLALGSVLAAAGLAVGLALTGAFGGSDTGSRATHRGAPVPEDGSLLRVRGGKRIYVVKAAARFPVPHSELSGFGYSPGQVQPVSAARLAHIPTVPADGKLLRAFGSSLVWKVRRGKRLLTSAPGGLDVAVMPTTGLRQIRTPVYHRKTKIALVAPPIVIDKRFFHIFMKVTSPSGKPAGACVVYREQGGQRQERSNTSVQGGLCTARIRVSGASKVEYVLRFIGAPGWRSSSTSTGPIPVIPNPGA
jgi:hypothetical protein